MINARRLNALLWAINIVLMIACIAFAFIVFAPAERHVPGPYRPPVRAIDALPGEPQDLAPLSALPNPLRHSKEDEVPGIVVHLIGTDRILGDPASITAYLAIPARKLNVNAFLGESVRDLSGREVPELSGWLLKSVTPKTAVFSTPTGERTLRLEEITASRASAQVDVRTALNEATELYLQGRLAEADVKFEAAFRMRPSAEIVYALILRVGDDVIASMLTSGDEKIRNHGYRLFELAKPGGDRIRPRAANA